MFPRLPKLVAFFSVATVALACGPWFPSTVIDQGDAGLLAPPTVSFNRLLDAALPPTDFKANNPPRDRDYDTDLQSHTFEAEQADLRAAGVSEAVIAAYRERRSETAANPEASATVSRLPKEFALYFGGARAYRAGDYAKARKSFTAVLDLPDAKRRYKTVWAAYMLGKCAASEGDRTSATLWFTRTREFARAGFADSTGLAAASHGEEGRLAYNHGQWLAACEHYLRQHATGDSTSGHSLQFTAARAVNETDPGVLAQFVAAPGPRAAMTAYLLSRAQATNTWESRTELSPLTQNGLTRWLAALENAGAPASGEASAFALAAYSLGNYADCARWLKFATDTDPAARWLRIKLALRDGRVAEATDQLASLVQHVAHPQPDLDTPQLHAELAQLRLASRDYADALRLLLRGGYWMDAAYVAERVLSIDELARFIAAEPDYGELTRPLKHLLARRLIRAGRHAEADTYFNKQLATTRAEFAAHLNAGRDPARPAVARGLSLARAAEILRRSGMDLQGTELEPDYAYTGGNFSGWPSMLDARTQAAGIAPPSDDEITRALVVPATPNRRFHYRYQAADLAWEAAQLLPDNSTELVNLLMEAGGWIKARDPQAADRFYKALVNRCPDTDLGRDAKRIRWFPTP